MSRIVKLGTLSVFVAGFGFLTNADALTPLCDQDYGSTFLNAVADRDVNQIKKLLANGADPNATSRGVFPLMLTLQGQSTNCARLTPDKEIFNLLVEAGADVRKKHIFEDRQIIHMAAAVGEVDFIAMAIRSGAAVDTRAKNGVTPLMIAIFSGHADAVDFLLRSGANPNATAGESKETPLHLAARRPGQDNRVAKLLVTHGAKYQINGHVGPFYPFAQFYRQPTGDIGELIDLFKRAGGDINEQASRKEQMLDGVADVPPPHTPLNVGLISTHAPQELFEAMLQKGANPNMGALYALAGRNDFGNVPLKRKDLLALLFQYGARVELTPRSGKLDILESARVRNPVYYGELTEIVERYSKNSSAGSKREFH